MDSIAKQRYLTLHFQIKTKSPLMKDNSSFKNIIQNLVTNGCKRITDIHIKNIDYTEKNKNTIVSFTLSEPVFTYQQKQDGSCCWGRTSIIYTNISAIIKALLEDEEISWMASPFMENPEYLNLILNGAHIDILQQEVLANTKYKNPFGNPNTEGIIFDHNVIINHILGFKLSETGKVIAEKLVDKLLGF